MALNHQTGSILPTPRQRVAIPSALWPDATSAVQLIGHRQQLYIAGHRHTWGLMSTEIQGRVVWVRRANGFKNVNQHETVRGFEVQRLGHTITGGL